MTPEEKIHALGFTSVGEYQAFHGLPITGVVDELTIASLDVIRFCSVPDKLPIGEGLPHWGKHDLKYAVLGVLPGIPLETMKSAAQKAFDRWAAVCDIRASHIISPAEAADILMGVGRIDGPNGVLAWSELPKERGLSPLNQRYGSNEQWVVADTVPTTKIDLIRVMAHELGHALGIGHLQAGNLLAPTYSTSINRPQSGDIAEVIRRYGPPRVVPSPAPPGTSGDNEWLTLRLPRKYLIN